MSGNCDCTCHKIGYVYCDCPTHAAFDNPSPEKVDATDIRARFSTTPPTPEKG